MIRASLVLAILASCSGSATPRSATEPAVAEATPVLTQGPADVLVDRMLHALETEDLAAWKDLLSAPMRARLGSDVGALHEHLMSWRRDVLPLASLLRSAELAVDATGPEPVVTYAADGRDAVALASVVVEGGTLHLDEN